MNANQSHTATRNQQGQIMFRVGQMLHFVTTRPFTLGQTGVQVRAGTDILFDGQHAEVDGAQYTLPFLRGAVKAGWMVLAEEYVEDDPAYQQRTPANIQVRPTKGGNPLDPQPRMTIATTESDEQLVGSARAHAQRTASQNRNYVRGQTTVNVVAPGQVVKTQRGMMTVEPQDGVEVDRQLQTLAGSKAKMARTDLTSEAATEAFRVAQNAQITPGKGVTEDEMLERMSEQDRAEYLAKKDALRAQYVADPTPTPPLVKPAARKVVARVQTAKAGQSEGMQFKNTVGGGTTIGDAADGEVVGSVHQSEDVVETFEQEGIKFTTTNASRKKAPSQKAEQGTAAPVATVAPQVSPEVRRNIAKALCPDFPDNYDFALSPKKKLARITADFEDRHDVIRAIFAAEADEMKALLVQEFPKAFEAK